MRKRRIPVHLVKQLEAQRKELEKEEFDNVDLEHTNLLALLFRVTKQLVVVTSKQWTDWLRGYVRDPRVGVKQTSKARSSEESNLRRGLTNPGMTVKNFTRALRVFRPRHITFTLYMKLRNWTDKSYTVEYTEDKLFSRFHNKDCPDNHNFLRMLWDKIYADLGFTEEGWKKMVTDHLDQINPEDKQNLKSSERSNLRRGLSCANMTIRIFTKALCVINPEEITLEMSMQLLSGSRTTTRAVMEGNSLLSSPFDEDDDNGNT